MYSNTVCFSSRLLTQYLEIIIFQGMVVTMLPKKAYSTALKESGGTSTARGAGSLPRNNTQTQNFTKRVPGMCSLYYLVQCTVSFRENRFDILYCC